MFYLLLALLLLNVATLAAFWLDKRNAAKGNWRMPEANFLKLAILGGWPALKLGQRLFRHKTRKQPFASRLNLVSALNLVGLMAAYSFRFTNIFQL